MQPSKLPSRPQTALPPPPPPQETPSLKWVRATNGGVLIDHIQLNMILNRENLGSVFVSMSLFQSRLCFVCSHLTFGQKVEAEQRRISDIQIFWFGNLSYRLNMLDTEIRKLVAVKWWDELIKRDKLSKELHNGHVFVGWKEGVIDFPSTYKYEINSDRYVGENPKEVERKRSPAWCDRILYLGKGIKQLLYEQAEMRLSDHCPVSSIFTVEVEVFNHRKLQRALNFTCAVVHPEIFIDEDG